ncbi:MAG TPA: chorismate synthase [Rectinemataceae bacterium]
MNSFGRFFRVEIFGESHGPAIGVVIDGCPPGIAIGLSDFDEDLARRRSGAVGTTPRRESDLPEILSGIYDGFSTGSPITILFRNQDTRSQDYASFQRIPRPGHADFTSFIKYRGFADPRGSGHFSGRVTAGLVAAGTIAKKILRPAQFSTRILEAGGSVDIEKAVSEAAEAGDSVGALVEIRVAGLEPGLGEPFFDACESLVAHAVFAVPGVRALEFGDGRKVAAMRGSEHNDPFVDERGRTSKNGSGGVNGGITNGNELVMRVSVKPTSSISIPQTTFDFERKSMAELRIEGRHDACIALRSAVVLESAAALALADMALADMTSSSGKLPRDYESNAPQARGRKP